jgi:hypothetical protein
MTLTPAARAWLSTTTHARVLNAFDRACNLVNQEGALLALVASRRGLNPFSMVIDSVAPAPFREVSTASPVSVGPRHLSIGALQFHIPEAEEWNPVPDWPAIRNCLAINPNRAGELAALALEAGPSGSLLELYTRGDGTEREAAMLDRVRRGALNLVTGLSLGSLKTCQAGVQQLAGLGGGLTPAGDDYIVGVLLAIWAGRFGPDVQPYAGSLAEIAAPRTTLLSAAYLRAAAGGECLLHWHAVFDALCRNDWAALRLATGDLLSIGHTSGADSIAGFLAIDFVHKLQMHQTPMP